jgi:sigma-B regulation protein RsbU (phosphoserine phosphatase)
LEGLFDLILGSALGTIGLLALLVSLLRGRRVDPLLASFGCFALLYGIREVLDTGIVAAHGLSALQLGWATTLITYIVPIPAWIFFSLLFSAERRSLLYWWPRVVTLFAIVAVATDLWRGVPGMLSRHPNNVLVIAGLLVATFAMLKRRRQLAADLPWLLAGFAIFGIFVLNDNLVSMRLLPWRWTQESIGLSALLACLGVIAARASLRKERQFAAIESELETARAIQNSLLPGAPPNIPGLRIASRYLPSSAVGGDLYDFFTAPGHAGIGVLVADVAGHGVPAALIASMVKVAAASQRACLERPAQLLERMQAALFGSLKRGFVTAAYLHVDAAAGRLVAACAGHPRPILARAAATGEPETFEVGGSGPILGRFRDASFTETTLDLRAGDRLVVYTDGLIEAPDGTGEGFGERRLREFLAHSAALAAEDLCDALLGELRRWTARQGPLALPDDLTLVVVDFDGEPGLARRDLA